MLILWVAGGGAVGAVLRYLLVEYIHTSLSDGFPYGTLAVNVMGSFAIGALAAIIHTRVPVSEEMRSLLMVGILGAFTTFSSFSLDTINLIQANQLFLAGINVVSQIVLCLLATTLAWYLFRSA